jgi:monoamine oxidase
VTGGGGRTGTAATAPGKPDCDVAVVGAGMAGLNAALSIAESGRSVRVHEASARLGGRVETGTLGPGLLAEFGPMRIEPDVQTELRSLLERLGVETEPTHAGYAADCASPTLTEAHGVRADEVGLDGLGLIRLAVRRLLGRSDAELEALSEDDLSRLRREATHAGRPLWAQGFWNVLYDVLSPEALDYVATRGSFYHFIHKNHNAAEEVVFFVRLFKTRERLRGVKGGMENITRALTAALARAGVVVETGRRLAGLRTVRGGVRLTFAEGPAVTAGRVVLAVPPPALAPLANALPEQVREALHAVRPVNLLKIFFRVKDPWWSLGAPPNRGANAALTREIHLMGPVAGEHGRPEGMVMIYTDEPYSELWRKAASAPLGTQDTARSGPDAGLTDLLARVLPESRGKVLSVAMRDWSLPPCGGGAWFWQPGYRPWEVWSAVSRFSLADDVEGRDNVHLCGEAFSDYQGFIEGALRTSSQVARMVTADAARADVERGYISLSSSS